MTSYPGETIPAIDLHSFAVAVLMPWKVQEMQQLQNVVAWLLNGAELPSLALAAAELQDEVKGTQILFHLLYTQLNKIGKVRKLKETGIDKFIHPYLGLGISFYTQASHSF